MIRVFCLLALLAAAPAAAADQWIEVKSAHFTITSNAGKGPTSTLAWQLEQMRSEAAVLWPWAKLDLNRPLVVFALKDEQSLKALAPEYWEKKNGGGNVATVWASSYERTFLLLRTDVDQDFRRHVNPYASSYFAYFSLILQQSVPKRLPPWFSRGLAAVLSNTVISDESVLVGAPAPWYLETLREGRRLLLGDLVSARRDSPLLKSDLSLFDAEAWGLVHYLMYGEKGARSNALGRYAALVINGTDPDVAFRETLGQTADLVGPVRAYVDRQVFAYVALKVDAEVKRETFAITPIPPAEMAARRALLHVAMRRPVEARAAIDEARKAGGAPAADVADGLLLDSEDKDEAARAAFTRAVDGGTTDAFAHYRLAELSWTQDANKETLTRIEALLSKAVSLNVRFAAAYDFLAQVKADLGNGKPSSLAMRAVVLEPSNAHHRLTAARLLAEENLIEDALKQLQAAAELAEGPDETREVAELRAWIERRKGG